LDRWIKNFNGRPFFSCFFIARANQKIRILALGGASMLFRSMPLPMVHRKSVRLVLSSSCFNRISSALLPHEWNCWALIESRVQANGSSLNQNWIPSHRDLERAKRGYQIIYTPSFNLFCMGGTLVQLPIVFSRQDLYISRSTPALRQENEHARELLSRAPGYPR
jgi:hypothetical protein